MSELIPENKPRIAWWIIVIIIIGGVLLITIGLAVAVNQIFANKIYPGVTAGEASLSGLTVEQAERVITGQFDEKFHQSLPFSYNQTNKDLSFKFEDQDVIKINTQAMAENAYRLGRQSNVVINTFSPLWLMLTQKDVPTDIKVDRYLLEKQLKQEFGGFESPASEPQLELNIFSAHNYFINFNEPKAGQGFDYANLVEQSLAKLNKYDNSVTVLALISQVPKYTVQDAENLHSQITEALNLDNINIFWDTEKTKVDWIDYAKWLEIYVNTDYENKLSLRLNKELVRGHLESLAQAVNQPAQDAKFQMKDNKVVEFSASQNGREVDLEKSYEKINDAIINQKQVDIEVVVAETEPNNATAEVNEMGIKELIGVGKSSFPGSPANRRHNIGVGAAALNGMLIKPGEEFSLITTLGSIDAESGYLPELVIKENKTIPEFGGGLCQVGTTTFRMALDAGLPITERRNHSYRVSYYEPAGTDATIYDPKPDFRFVNDTGNYILIQAKVIKDDLRFELWGTKDGRKVEQTAPTIYNIVAPGPTKIIESADLKPGEKKCTEKAHNGADAYFDRKVTYANGEVKEERWKSHYVPWQAVCLVGIDPNKVVEPPVVEPVLPPAPDVPVVPPTT